MSRTIAEPANVREHLHELRRRLFGSVLVLIVGGSVTYAFRLEIIRFLDRPLHEPLYYTSPMGSFQFIMQICLLCGFILALPVLLYNVLRFIEPALEHNFSHKLICTTIGVSLGLAATGIAFGYYLTLPFALQFFSSVGTNSLRPLISVNEYFNFVVDYLATFAVVFQLPLVLSFINHIRPFPPGSLPRIRKWVYIAAFAISLIMPSSPDPLSQVSLAIPIIVLYEVSILLIWHTNRQRYRRSPVAAPIAAWRRNVRPAMAATPQQAAQSSPGLVPRVAAAARPRPSVTSVKRPTPASRISPLIVDVQTYRRNYQVPLAPRPKALPIMSRPQRLIDDFLT